MRFIRLSIASITCLLASGTFAQGQVTTDGNDLVINTNGGLSVATSDGDYSVKLGGRLQWDYNQAEENDIVGEDGFDIRRARLYVSGDVNDWGYKAQFNIGNGNGGTPEDLYIRYNGMSNGMTITIGRQKEPFGLEQLTSSQDNSMLERTGPVEAYTPGRSDGIQLNGAAGDVYYGVGVFEDEDSSGTSDFTLSGRVTSALVNTGSTLVHLGAGYTTRGDDISTVGIEAAYSAGPLHVQGEYFSSDNAGSDLDGYYLQAGWIISGESRPYSKGVFGRVKPTDAAGAWEVVVRYEAGDGNYSDIELGRTDATAVSIGVNWYANSLTRLGINYTTGEDENSADSGSELRARIQFAF
jgi:phosphate-selective porin OprO/OprP